MKSILTLDYELFFGKKVGSPQISIIHCTNKLLSILDKFDAKAVFFVDVTYLLRLKALRKNFPQLNMDYNEVVQHIKSLESDGHQIQLHIHPHWLDSHYDNGNWHLDISRYKLADWSKQESTNIINQCVKELNCHLVNPVFAFRAGGWCIQPFNHIKSALKENNIWLDSTVFKNGQSLSKTHAFNFNSVPQKAYWHFEEDPCVEDKNGYFTEIPIASRKISPLFYWKFAFTKKFNKTSLHSSYADGQGINSGKKDMIRMLTRSSNSVVSVDGYRSSFLVKAYKKSHKQQNDYFVVIGHPKLLTPYSLINIEKWLNQMLKNGENLCLYER